MNASMARRIRQAEALLISAIDRQNSGQREWSQQKAQPQQEQPRISPPIGESRVIVQGDR